MDLNIHAHTHTHTHIYIYVYIYGIRFGSLSQDKMISRVHLATMLNCKAVVCKFKFQSRYYIYFSTNILGKGMNLAYHRSYGLNNSTTLLPQG